MCASSGEEMVSLAAESRLRIYTNFCFSTAPVAHHVSKVAH